VAMKWMKRTTRLRIAESSYKSECQEKNLPRWLDADTFFGLGILRCSPKFGPVNKV
jgi:hypothetical protein